jgi:hypothetical protein
MRVHNSKPSLRKRKPEPEARWNTLQGSGCLCVLLTCVVLVLGACRSDPHSPQGVAEKFLDTHYVNIDLPAAKAYCTGLALSRVEEEIRLTVGHLIDESTRKPQVYYRFIEERPRGDSSTSLLYDATFTMAGAEQFKKKILLTLRRGEEGWRVANYSEFD